MDILDILDFLTLAGYLFPMPTLDGERIGIVGLGAIGGSLALALRNRAAVLAWSRDDGDRAGAAAAGIALCHEARWAAEIGACTIVVIAVPMDGVAEVARHLLPHTADASLVMHTASLQRREALGVTEAESRRVLGAHPIAGSERSGFSAATHAMFRDATVRAEARADNATRARLEMMWRAAGVSRLVWDDASSHDALMAWISHLPQLAATSLAAVLAEQGVRPTEAGPGARDMTRLAASDLGVWAPLLERAPRETLEALRRLTSALETLGDAVEQRDRASVAETWERARAWRHHPEERP